MPSRLIEDEDGTSAWRDRNRDFLEMHGHGVALSRSWVLLVNSAGRSRSACLYINTLGRLSRCQIGSKMAYGQCDVAVMRTAQKGIVHPNAAARKVSRLCRRINALSK